MFTRRSHSTRAKPAKPAKPNTGPIVVGNPVHHFNTQHDEYHPYVRYDVIRSSGGWDEGDRVYAIANPRGGYCVSSDDPNTLMSVDVLGSSDVICGETVSGDIVVLTNTYTAVEHVKGDLYRNMSAPEVTFLMKLPRERQYVDELDAHLEPPPNYYEPRYELMYMPLGNDRYVVPKNVTNLIIQ